MRPVRTVRELCRSCHALGGQILYAAHHPRALDPPAVIARNVCSKGACATDQAIVAPAGSSFAGKCFVSNRTTSVSLRYIPHNCAHVHQGYVSRTTSAFS